MQIINQYLTNDCLLCDSKIPQSQLLLCQTCHADIELYPLGCDLLHSYPNVSAHFQHDAIQGVAVITNYQWPFDQWIPQVKFHNHICSAKLMAQLLNLHLQHCPWPKADLICPMPIHLKRRRQRGYNQSELLCKFIDYLPSADLFYGLIRNKHTQAQSELNKTQRKSNMKGAFECEANLSGKIILLVDDVITTGHTANYAAKSLLKAGATAVYLAAVAISKLN